MFVSRENFEKVTKKMVEVAEDAAIKSFNEILESARKRGLRPNHDYIDMCGGAYLTLTAKSSENKQFIRMLKTYGTSGVNEGSFDGENWGLSKGYPRGFQLSVRTSIRSRQEVTPKEDAMRAVQLYLENIGIRTFVRSYLS